MQAFSNSQKFGRETGDAGQQFAYIGESAVLASSRTSSECRQLQQALEVVRN